MAKHNTRIFGLSPFFKLQNNTYTVKSEMHDTHLLLTELFCYGILASSAWKNNASSQSRVPQVRVECPK